MEILTIVIGVVMPAVISFLKKQTWSQKIKSLFAMGVCVVAGTATLAAQGEIDDIGDIVNESAVIWAISQATYQLWFGSTGLNKKLEDSGI